MNISVTRLIVRAWIGCQCVAVCHAQPPADAPIAGVNRSREAIAVNVVTEAPSIDDFLEGRSPAPPSSLTRVDGFVQRVPDDGKPATEDTTVYLAHDQTALYVVFVASDKDPQKLRTQLRRRDTTPDDEDSVGVVLDTFQDQRRAYQFWSSPLGVQNDGVFSEDTLETDRSFDAVWHSRGVITSAGYVVWMAIPFKSLRFSTESQTWGLLLYRRIGRRAEDAWLPHVSTRIRGRLNQAGAIRLTPGSPARNIQAVPYMSSRTYRVLDTVAAPSHASAPSFSAGGDASVGVDFKMVIRDSVVLDVAVNPDFSQVESDEPQSVINQRFEVFFPEKRPFFTENATYFDTPSTARLLFTRRIADPQAGIRLTGKLGPQSIGVIIADDQAPGRLAEAGSPLVGRRALVGALRYSRDLPRRSNVGAMLTERHLAGSYNRVLALDGTSRWSPTWSASVTAAYSTSQDLQRVRTSGSNVQVSVRRDSRTLNTFATVIDRDPDFKTDVGFVRRTDIREIDTGVSYRFWSRRKWLQDVWPGINLYQIWDTSGTNVLTEFNPTMTISLRHPTTLTLAQRLPVEVLRPKDYAALPQNRRYSQRWFNATLASSLSKVTLKTNVEVGRRINYLPPVGAAPLMAPFIHWESGLSFRPARSGIVVDNTYFIDRYMAEEGTATAFRAEVIRSRVNWQMTRRLAARVIAQYERTSVNSLYSRARARRALNADILVSYMVQPGTELYVGYNNNAQQIGDSLAGPWADTFINDGRQLFVKVSYRLPF